MAPPKQPSSLLRLKDAWIKFMSLVFFAGLTVNFLEILMRLFFHSSIDLFYDIPI